MITGIDKRAMQARSTRNVFVMVLVLNLLVTVGKLVWGFSTHTLTMMADGFHSLLDASANVVAIVGLSISFKPADSGHPYGHKKFEALTAIAISFFMFLASFEILGEALHRVVSKTVLVPQVGLVSYVIMLLTLAINILVARYEGKKARELDSRLLEADVKHTLSDVLSTLTVLATLVAVQLKMPWFDLIAALGIVVIILKAGVGIILDNFGTLVDAAILDPGFVEKLVHQVPGVTSCHKIRSRGMHDHIFLDLHIQVPSSLSVEEAHRISYQVEEKLIAAGGGIVDVLVHIEDDCHVLRF